MFSSARTHRPALALGSSLQRFSACRTLAAVLAISLVCGILFLWKLGATPFFTNGEPREAVQVWDEVHRGNWILPLRNGTEIPSKPPLFHWLGGLASLARGTVDEMSVRAPSALLATVTVFIVFLYGRREWGLAAGLYAALILATNFEWIRAAREARVDMTLTACMTGSLLAMGTIVSRRVSSWSLWIVMYVCAGLAVLAKGPVGLVLPSLIGVVHLIVTRDVETARSLRPLAGGLLAVSIPLVWYLAAVVQGGNAFIEKQLVDENVLRFVGAGSMAASHAHPFYYHFFSIAAGFAPWSLFLPSLVLFLFRLRGELAARGYLFPLLWFVVIFLFYSAAAGKRTVYLLPLYPAAALLLGAWWAELHGSETLSGAARVTIRFCSWLAVAVAALCTLVTFGESVGVSVLELIAPVLHHRDEANVQLVRQALRCSRGPAAAYVAVALTAALALAACAHGGRWRGGIAALVLYVVSVAVLATAIVLPVIARARSYEPFARVVRESVPPEATLKFFRAFDYAVVFYAGRHIPVGADDFDSVAADYLLLPAIEWEGLQPTERKRLKRISASVDGGADHQRLILAEVLSEGRTGASDPIVDR